jgi:phosphopantothenoylcysteine decarboxylase/phosphopantothenate--cysteine ligase
MGYAVAEELAGRGARVTLVSGYASVCAKHPAIKVERVATAAEMYAAALSAFEQADGAVMAAAVADFTPEKRWNGKLKREGAELTLKLVATKDIAAALGRLKRDDQALVGFALEAANEQENALRKLREKNLDFIVLNSMNDAGAGFNVDTNKICIIDRSGAKTPYPLKPKAEVAADIVDKIVALSA